MPKRWIAFWALVGLLGVNVALAFAAPRASIPGHLASYFFGPRMVRAEVIVKEGPVLRDFRIDRGRLREVRGNALVLLELDGTIATIPVAPNADVRVHGRPARLTVLRPGILVLTIRDGEAPATIVRAGSLEK